ncbi:2,3-diaminopropionate biosynthesis protein SbnA [Paenibacillus sp. N1-5-1-14]|uniref:2,3-diaminopropionate biosynthesis protein SbnA n=1 Tax=Paenibacillus radicibacter TaxID=2972488 RepID=UPI002159ABB4|nr:2,3-diaminopropionate biosynthesis protein SbnA [Paenibacillus radicibacter]MCR8642094.1 2,3-diaminopropionate biosynthesis protein SbnA [Paenibacillus radicibacter]
MDWENGILGTIGNTPLVKLNKLFDGKHYELYAKLEGLNPGGSSKDRSARQMLRTAYEEGLIKPGATIVESSSGNLGISLAQICAFLGLRFICVIDPRTTEQNIRILRTYGAEVDLVSEPDSVTGEFLPARIARVQEIRNSIPDAYWPNQYANKSNPLAHSQYTMHEIVQTLGRVDYLFCAVSTCGTIRGCLDYVNAHHLTTKVIAVDAVGSVIFDQEKCKRLLPGIGAGIKPALSEQLAVHDYVHVYDRDSVQGCYQLLRKESILAGGSSGTVIAAISQYARHIENGAVCAAILPDRGERYMDTIYDESWIKTHFGQIEGASF